MRLRNYLAAGSVLLALIGCGEQGGTNPNTKRLFKESFEAKAMGVAVAGGSYGVGDLSVVFEMEDGSYILGHADLGHIRNMTRAAALIRSEMNDGDDERVKVTGVGTEDGYFSMSSVYANGKTIEFK